MDINSNRMKLTIWEIRELEKKSMNQDRLNIIPAK